MPFVLVHAPGDVTPGHAVAPTALEEAVEEVHGDEPQAVDVLHGVNLDQLGRRDPTVYGTFTLAELRDSGSRAGPPSWSLEVTVLADQPRGRVLRDPAPRARARRRPDPEPRRLDALLLRHPRRARGDRGLPAVEVHISEVDSRDDWRAPSVIRDLCVGRVQGKGVEGYREALEILKAALGA